MNRLEIAQYLVSRMREASTWRALCLLLTALGWAISPDDAAFIGAVGMAAAGFLGALLPDRADRRPEHGTDSVKQVWRDWQRTLSESACCRPPPNADRKVE